MREGLRPCSFQRVTRGRTPVLRAAQENRYVLAPSSLQEAGRGHAPLAMPAMQRQRTIRQGHPTLLEIPQFDVPGARDVAGVELRTLPDIDESRPGSVLRVNEGEPLLWQAGLSPGGHP